MGKPKVRPPSRVDALPFPVFGLTWHGSPCSSPSKGDGCSVVAYCGGGGSAKTGVGNKIVVTVDAYDNSGGSDPGSSSPAADDVDALPPPPTFVSRRIEISTGEALCFGVHAFRPPDDRSNTARLLACVGDEVLLYGIPLARVGGQSSGEYSGDEDKEEATLLGKTNVGKGYGANVATYSLCKEESKFNPATATRLSYQPPKLLHCVAVGCENGAVVVFQLNQTDDKQFEFAKISECKGHTKAVCAVNFHPREMRVLSSAKDGTARVFDARDGSELGVMKCEVHDPSGPPPVVPAATTKTKDPRMMRRAPQILVRGCFYGDLEGRAIYTVASGKRGPAYLARWDAPVPRSRAGPAAPPGPPGGGPPEAAAPPRTEAPSFRPAYRIECSPVPVSAASLSSDGALLALGSVEGSVSLYDLENRRVARRFPEVHDLPVTCVASRPVPRALALPGEEEGGVSYDATSASADNRQGRYTLQKRSRLVEPRRPRSRRERNFLERFLWDLVRIPLLLALLLVVIAVKDTVDMCGEEFELTTLVMDSGASAGRCLYREVLWAEQSRVSFVPE
mmetsp:Transcript_34694/g.73919  ORF Transcript_34694/g.73919 Transcript_34694/m.73919 type:complete len:564 (+) Transcript_34694:204-1895(+)